MGYWQKESEFGKKVGCFKASLGSLGLNKPGAVQIGAPLKVQKEQSVWNIRRQKIPGV